MHCPRGSCSGEFTSVGWKGIAVVSGLGAIVIISVERLLVPIGVYIHAINFSDR